MSPLHAMAESTSGSSSAGPAPKKQKRPSKWQPEWARYNMTASRRGPTYAHCKLCDTDFAIAGGGVHEVKRHMETKKHKENAKGMENQLTLQSALSRSRNSLEDDITAAELYFTTFISEHNIPFLAADHFTKLCKVMFPESKVAEGFSCGRTKTTAIVNVALAPSLNADVIKSCQNISFYFVMEKTIWQKVFCYYGEGLG